MVPPPVSCYEFYAVARARIGAALARLPVQAWQPILTPRWVVITFLLVGVPFVAIGFWLKWASDRVRGLRAPGTASTGAWRSLARAPRRALGAFAGDGR